MTPLEVFVFVAPLLMGIAALGMIPLTRWLDERHERRQTPK